MPSAVDVACVGLRLLSAVGVRMARTGFSAIDIYLYTDDVTRDCGAFSCLCGGVGGLCCCVYGCIKVLFRVMWWCVYVFMYIMRLWLVLVVVVVVCSYMDRYI